MTVATTIASRRSALMEALHPGINQRQPSNGVPRRSPAAPLLHIVFTLRHGVFKTCATLNISFYLELGLINMIGSGDESDSPKQDSG